MTPPAPTTVATRSTAPAPSAVPSARTRARATAFAVATAAAAAILALSAAAGSVATGRGVPPVWSAVAGPGGLTVRTPGPVETTVARRRAPERIAPDAAGGGVVLDGRGPVFDLSAAAPAVAALDPVGAAFTASAWVAIEAGTRWGGIVGRIRDDGGLERGWLLGYDQRAFTVALSTEGADDGDGRLTYLAGATSFEPGRWHHVAATWDGTTARLFVDGRLDAEATTGPDFPQAGAIVHDAAARLVVGGYVDPNERYALRGRLGSVRVEPVAVDGATIAARVAAEAGGRLARPAWLDPELAWTIEPYLTWPATDAVSVLAETRDETEATLTVRPAAGGPARTLRSRGTARRHEFRVTGLEANTAYVHQMTCVRPAGSGPGAGVAASLTSRAAKFRTAPGPDDAYTFVAIGDTQAQPDVVRRVAAESWGLRPGLVVIAGDLVTTGGDTSHWTDHFFPNMRPLIEHVAMATVLGNHEQDARNYYDYLALPGNERWYVLPYGNAEFFMLDGNRPLDPGSEQHGWLEDALAASAATWRFVVVHQPPWTSDADDYGDTRTGEGTRGDANVRHIIPLLETWGVDICFSGHVHDYERTFPILDGRPARWADGGVVYVTTAGGGGHLEAFDPARTPFGNVTRRTHHLVHVAVNGLGLEYRAYDDAGRLFDVMFLEKPADGSR